MGVCPVRSLQPPDILWIHWRVCNSIVNTSKPVLFLPPSDVYVRSFLYLLYTLIKHYYTKALSDQALSLAPDWILLLRRPRIPVSFRGSATTFHYDFSAVSANLETQQWPQDRKRSVFIPIPKKGNAKECSNYRTSLGLQGDPTSPFWRRSALGFLWKELRGCCWITRIHQDSWLLEEKNSIRGQRQGLIAQSFCVIKFY